MARVKRPSRSCLILILDQDCKKGSEWLWKWVCCWSRRFSHKGLDSVSTGAVTKVTSAFRSMFIRKKKCWWITSFGLHTHQILTQLNIWGRFWSKVWDNIVKTSNEGTSFGRRNTARPSRRIQRCESVLRSTAAVLAACGDPTPYWDMFCWIEWSRLIPLDVGDHILHRNWNLLLIKHIRSF